MKPEMNVIVWVLIFIPPGIYLWVKFFQLVFSVLMGNH
ncbi:hypothetical protein SAMN05443635_11366 [Roseobacter denitrificans OCh 114]|uniref:Uncharacterized protein n=1 Tax=Roseobacter denitrificans (strain ATCC 33942 / OCh 114) TaxID=375451 RepID=Q16A90_ROSDO|nr:hypothetical protein RD1_1469 [Roseobacter denitrificans OCh 114]SFG32814.1 hypothetical protein SAMN05443635_11366 [Roseobacter denitrificans OCh 114]